MLDRMFRAGHTFFFLFNSSIGWIIAKFITGRGDIFELDANNFDINTSIPCSYFVS